MTGITSYYAQIRLRVNGRLNGGSWSAGEFCEISWVINSGGIERLIWICRPL